MPAMEEQFLYKIQNSPLSTISHSSIYNNFATSNGGGVHIIDSAYLSFMQNSIMNNKAKSGGGGGFYMKMQAGNNKNNKVSPTSSSYSGQTIKDGDNIMLSISSSNFSENVAPNGGGGLSCSFCKISITSSRFIGNTAQGKNGGGGLICLNCPIFSLSSSSFISNSVNSLGGGGAIYLEPALNATISSSVFTMNTASSNGGALRFSNSLSIYSSTFTNNTSNNYGGAVYSKLAQSYTSVDNSFLNNTSSDDGGAIYLSCLNQTSISLTDSLFAFNNGGGTGGSAYLKSCDSVQIYNSTFEANVAQEHSGGIHLENSTFVNISSSSFSHNAAMRRGGGLQLRGVETAIVNNSTFIRNLANSTGGGIDFHSTDAQNSLSLSCNNSEFIGNVAKYNGGGLALTSDNGVPSGKMNVTLYAVTFLRNEANGPNGEGGGISVDNSSFVKMIDSHFLSNRAVLQGGGLYLKSGIELLSKACIFRNNSATALASSSSSLHSDSPNSIETGGGAIGVAGSCRINLENAYFFQNSANSGGAIYLDSNNYLTIKETHFQANIATNGQGGALCVTVLNIITASKVSMASNVARKTGEFFEALGNGGGAISMTFFNTLTLTDSVIEGNKAIGFGGGAIFADQSNTFISKRTLFRGNLADTNGGAVLMLASQTVNMQDSTMQDNIAISGTGGGMDLGQELDLVVFNCSFVNNAANGTSCGALKIGDNSMGRIAAVLFQSNSAALQGGAVCLLSTLISA